MPLRSTFGTPALRMVLVLLLCAASLSMAVWTAARQPATGLSFRPGDRLSSDKGSMVIDKVDLTPEPGIYEDYATLERFYTRQSELGSIVSGGAFTISGEDEERMAATRPRGIEALPEEFWIQVIVGLGALIISGWVWALRPRDLAANLFALSGAATLAFTLSAAIYSTRELVLPVHLFWFLRLCNMGGSSLFGMAMIALFLVYPVRLPGWPILMAANVIAFGLWTLLAMMWLVPDWALFNLVTLVEMIFICSAIAAQYFATRKRPEARAVLTWFGLSVLIGAGAFIALNAAPLVLDIGATVDQAYAFLFFLIIYFGLAAGLRRYRLFELDGWAYRILFIMVGAAILLALDAVLALAMSLERVQAFGISLIAVAFLYLPLRDVLARRFLRYRSEDREALFEKAVDVALTPPGQSQSTRWRELMSELFDPLRIKPAPHSERVEIGAEGLKMTIPAVGEIAAIDLEYGYGGRRLFSPRDRTLAGELVSMLRHAIESRRSFEKGVAEERRRIARDMHDNIGAQLLGALHSRETERKDTMIRETLSDLRDIINNASRTGLPLDETLADLRMETAERLSSAGIALEWKIDAHPTPVLAPNTAHALRSMLREAVSNVIRHSSADRLNVSIHQDGNAIRLAIEDDGHGFDQEKVHTGYGLANMTTRVAGLGGSLDIVASETGTRLEARVPFERPGELA